MDSPNTLGPIKTELTCNHPSSFHEILDKIHDSCFWLDEVRFDEAAGEVVIPFTVEDVEHRKICSRWGFALYEDLKFAANLVISHVLEFEVVDNAQIGRGNVNTMRFADGTLTIRCGVWKGHLDERDLTPHLRAAASVSGRRSESWATTAVPLGLRPARSGTRPSTRPCPADPPGCPSARSGRTRRRDRL